MLYTLPDNAVLHKTLSWDTTLSDAQILSGLTVYFSHLSMELAFDFKRLDKHTLHVIAAPQEKINALLSQHKDLTVIEPESYVIKRVLSLTSELLGFYFITDASQNLIIIYIFYKSRLIFFEEELTLETATALFQKNFPDLSHALKNLTLLENKNHWITLGAKNKKHEWNLSPWRLRRKKYFYKKIMVSLSIGIIFLITAFFLIKKNLPLTSPPIIIKKNNFMNFFNQLDTRVPTGIYIKKITLENSIIHITGNAVTERQLTDYVNHMHLKLQNSLPDESTPPYHISFLLTGKLMTDPQTIPPTATPMTLTGSYAQIKNFMALAAKWKSPVLYFQSMVLVNKNNLLKLTIRVIFLP